MKLSKYIFRSRLAFAPVDPLGDGLREMIKREQTEAGAILLHEDDYDVHLWSDISQESFGDPHFET